MTAAVTFNTALELLRRPHDDVVQRAMPFFQDNVFIALATVCDFTLKQRGAQPMKLPMPRFYDLYDHSAWPDVVRELYDHLMIPNAQLLDEHARGMKNGHALVSAFSS